MIPPYLIVRYTAYLNIVFFLLILLTCRCIIFWKIAKALLGDNIFGFLNKYHCTYWYGFALSVAIHAIIAMYPQILY
jgi:hypothetical protein